ncbi:MAG TPA: hypothetical protein VED40_10055 [Azospirillaceae bacterium]|nr:hypothetical protein [Azospirillaceae bacterium]
MKRVLAVGALLVLTGCSPFIRKAVDRDADAIRANQVQLVAGDVQQFAQGQTAVVQQLTTLAGLSGPPQSAQDWGNVVYAGILYTDVRCENYLQALFRLNQAKTAALSELNVTRTAVEGALGLVKAASKEIALTSLAFGFVTDSVETISDGLLLQLDPSAVRTLVKGLQAEYRRQVTNTSYTSQPAALMAVQGYVSLCLPANIEAEINKSANTARPRTVPTGERAFGASPGTTAPAAPQPNVVPNVTVGDGQ